ncbi:MAG TPA: flagellar protein [Epulopiscium sp.]|nr:flagellar protein [Candidatus Epulonipiscium sp.]
MMKQINAHQIKPISLKANEIKPLVKPVSTEMSFNQVLQGTLNKVNLQYSKHADFRMKSLGIVRNKEFENQLEVAAGRARAKNIKEGLILKEDYGFVVSIKNNTVITVVDLKDKEDNVFTNIDGAVII